MNKIYNLTIATDIRGKGGVSSVINFLKNEKFFDKTNSKLLVSHANFDKFSVVKQMLLFFVCVCRLLYNLIFFNIGLVHIHMSSRGSYMRKSMLIRIVKFFKAKAIIHLHSGEFKNFYNDECSYRKKEHIRNTFNMADKVIVLSTQWLDWLNTILDDKNKGVVVYNGVSILSIEPAQRSEHFNFVFLGRLGDKKGVSDLIVAFSKVVVNHPTSRLLLGGDGELDKFKLMVNQLNLTKHVRFLGWISGDSKFDLLKIADSYILPSYNEGFPMGILEAMSCNIPIIASRVGGIPDAITSGEEGILINAGDVSALIEAMSFSIEYPIKIKEMQLKANEKYHRKFSSEIIIPKLVYIYKELDVI
ncbi:glycosyltransferase family 4 protein [Shewanella frigidimarina]|uniref:glycosyltransferase family 4 protein n=1 Tax=Shewanella frigidimarina TaxID=56812 RepID=UPI003D7A1357